MSLSHEAHLTCAVLSRVVSGRKDWRVGPGRRGASACMQLECRGIGCFSLRDVMTVIGKNCLCCLEAFRPHGVRRELSSLCRICQVHHVVVSSLSLTLALTVV